MLNAGSNCMLLFKTCLICKVRSCKEIPLDLTSLPFSFLVFQFSSLSFCVFPEFIPQAFSIPLSQVIANDRTHRQRQDCFRQDHLHREEQKDSSDLVSSILQVCHIYTSSYILVTLRQTAINLPLFRSLPQRDRPIRSYPAVTRL